MATTDRDSLRHTPEIVVSFVRRLVDSYCPNDGERRAEPRVALRIPIVMQLLDENFQPIGDTFDAVTKDISTGGIRVLHMAPLNARFFQVDAVSQKGEHMSLLAEVKHCTPIGDHHEIGARFVVDWSHWRVNESPNQ